MHTKLQWSSGCLGMEPPENHWLTLLVWTFLWRYERASRRHTKCSGESWCPVAPDLGPPLGHTVLGAGATVSKLHDKKFPWLFPVYMPYVRRIWSHCLLHCLDPVAGISQDRLALCMPECHTHICGVLAREVISVKFVPSDAWFTSHLTINLTTAVLSAVHQMAHHCTLSETLLVHWPVGCVALDGPGSCGWFQWVLGLQ